MNHLRVEVRPLSDPLSACDGVDEVRFIIDGEDLLDIVLAVERQNTPDQRVARYLGPPSVVALDPSRYLLGEPSGNSNWDDPSDFDQSEIAIGGCGCGLVGCWPLIMRIERHDDHVVWRDLYNWHVRDEGGDWHWSSIEPFAFDLADYERAISSPTRSP